MVNSPGHVGVVFAEIGTGLCETDIRRFQTSFLGPNASLNLVKTPVRPPFSIGTHERTTKLNGLGVTVGLPRRNRLGAGALAIGLAHTTSWEGLAHANEARKTGI